MRIFLTVMSCWLVLSLNAQVPGYVPQDGLVAWYDFADGACDVSGLAGCFDLIDGAYIGEVEGSDDLALRLDGNYAQLPADPSFNLYEFTIAFRYFFDEGSQMRMWKGNPDYPDDVNYVIKSSDETILEYNFNYSFDCGSILNNSPNEFSADAFQSPGVWLDVVVTRSSAGVVSLNTSNSSDVFTGIPAICNETQPIRIGHWWDGDPSPSFGWIDHLGFWSTVLTELEIAQVLARELVSIGCTNANSCNYDPIAEFDDGSCVTFGCTDTNACNFNSEAGCDDGSCLMLDPLLCDVDSIIEVDLCGQDSIQLGLFSVALEPFIPITQLNWKSSCEFQEGWNLVGFDDLSWGSPTSTACPGSIGDALTNQFQNCGGDDHMIWAGDCSSSYFRFPFMWDGASPLYLELGADDSFEAFLNGEFIFEGAGWETCYSVDQFQNALVGENLLAIKTADIGSCKGLFGKAYGPSFQQNFLWSSGEVSSQIWVDSPGIYTVDSFEDDATVAFIVTSANLQGCTDETACNYNELAVCDDSSCIHPLIGSDCSLGAVSCGQGTVWNSTNQICIPDPSICNEGTYWDDETQSCMRLQSCEEDLNSDGIIGIADLLQLLSTFGEYCEETIETSEFSCGDPMNYHGYDYTTVQIGEQCWFAENLRTELYQNGDSIISNLSSEEWASTSQGAVTYYGEGDSYCEYHSSLGFDPCENDELAISTFGRLYNLYSVNSGLLCPQGWTVPYYEHWDHLIDYVAFEGYEEAEAVPLKSITNWPNSSSNLLGFSVQPAGYRYPTNGGFYSAGWWASMHASWNGSGGNNTGKYLAGDVDTVNDNYTNVNAGNSVRCIKDTEE